MKLLLAVRVLTAHMAETVRLVLLLAVVTTALMGKTRVWEAQIPLSINLINDHELSTRIRSVITERKEGKKGAPLLCVL